MNTSQRIHVILPSLLTGVAMITAPASGQSAMIQQIIDNYEPMWLPPENEMRAMRVLLNPAGGGAMSADQHHRDELSLLTAAHLYHLINRSGGRAVLTRQDDRPLLRTGAGPSTEELRDLCAKARAHLLVSIDYSRNAGTTETSPFAAALAEATGSPGVVPIDVAGTSFPAAVVHFEPCDPSMPARQRRSFHRQQAEKIYKGLAAYVEGHRRQLLADAEKRWTTAVENDDGPQPDENREEYRRRRMMRSVRAIWPGGPLPPDKTDWFVSMFRRVALSDRTAVYFETKVTLDGDTAVLSGATTVPALRETIGNVLRGLELGQIRNEIRVLPDADRLRQQLLGVCSDPMAMTFVEPTETSGQQTQLLYGEPVFMLDASEDGRFLLVQASDGYCGWVRRESIVPLDVESFTRCLNRQQAVLLDELGLPEMVIPRGAKLPIVSEDDEGVVLARPGNRQIRVAADRIQRVDLAAQLEARALAALDLLGQPYVFGGRSPVGLDCSGLITNVCEREGIPIARDAAQQFLGGKLVATRWFRDALQPGDRVYFIDNSGKISHTGIAISATHFVHSSPPGVQISSLKKGDRLYNEHWDEHFLGAKRP